jgi:nitric oxide reductase activation protein
MQQIGETPPQNPNPQPGKAPGKMPQRPGGTFDHQAAKGNNRADGSTQPGSGEGAPGEGEGQPGEGQPGEGQPGEGQPGEGQPGEGEESKGEPGGKGAGRYGGDGTKRLPLKEEVTCETDAEPIAETPEENLAYSDTRVIPFNNGKPEPGYRARYEQQARETARQSRAIREKLKFRETEPHRRTVAQKSGSIDGGSLVRLFAPRPGEQNPRIFEKKTQIGRASVAVGLLIDESGSMRGSKETAARALAVMLLEALHGLPGVSVSVIGYTTIGNSCRLNHYITPDMPAETHKYNVMAIGAEDSTPTGKAIEDTSVQLAQWYPDAAQRLLFVVSDGSSAGGPRAVSAACKRARKRGIETIGLGVCGAYRQDSSDEMYGEGKGTVTKTIDDAGKVIASFLVRTLQRLK